MTMMEAMWIFIPVSLIVMVLAKHLDLKAEKQRIELQDAKIQRELNKLAKAIDDIKKEL